MQQYAEAVLACNFLHQRHQHHVVVNSEVGLFEDRCQLELVGGYLVVTCLTRNAQLQGLNLQVAHESSNALRDGAKVVVVHLLVLSGVVTHQLRSNLLDRGVKVVAHLRSSYVHSMQGTE